MPSKEDILTTIEIKKTLDFVNIKLIDHIIVADNDYVSLADSKLEDLIF
jgi:DNA repair protein RadC